MKGKKTNFTLGALTLVVTCGYVPASLAVPTTTAPDTLDYQGAHFTLDGEWDGGLLRMTYTADFGAFADAGDQSYLKAIDWKWEGGDIDSVSLTEAPGGTASWQTRTLHQIGGGIAPGCVETGESNAVCTEFIGGEAGVSTATDQLLTWVFEIHFRHVAQQHLLFSEGLRTAYVNEYGSLASPILSCGNIGGVDCASDLIQPRTLTLEGANVPVPGVPALLLIGLAGLSLTRGGKGKKTW